MLFGKKKQKHLDYDRENLYPAIRKSICTGEMTVGFKDRRTGKFTDMMMVRGDEELREFMETYGITEEPEIFY